MIRLHVFNEKGVAFLTVLMFLVALAVVGVAAMQMNTLEERMVGNSGDLNVAFQAAEAALRNGENDLLSGIVNRNSPFNNGCNNGGFCTPPANGVPWGLTTVWNNATTYRAYGAGTPATALAGPSGAFLNPQPKYIVELLPDVPLVPGNSLSRGINPPSNGTAYRVTSWGAGLRQSQPGVPQSQVVVQSVFVTQN
ncbi:MAG: pilus assembly PilX family protein [Nitrospiria bacterium]